MVKVGLPLAHDAVVGTKLRAATLFALIALGVLLIGLNETGTLYKYLDFHAIHHMFQSIVWDAIPFIVIGAVVSALIETYISKENLSALLSDSILGRIAATLLGLALPVCDCGAISVARTFRRKGVSESIAFSFVLATPTLNLVTLVATFVAFHSGWQWLLMRAGWAIVIAMVAGLIVHFRDDALTEKWGQAIHIHAVHHKGLKKLIHVGDHSVSELFAVGPFFVASAMLAAIAQGLWPIRGITAFTQHSVWSILLLMALGSVLSLCSAADAFVAASLTSLFSPGAVLAFLLMGQTVDIRNLVLMPKVFGKGTFILGLSVVVVLIFALALTTNRLMIGGWV